MKTSMIVASAAVIMILGSCSDVPSSKVRVSLDKDTLIVPSMLHVRLDDDHLVWEFGPDDFGPDPKYTGQWYGPKVPTANSGTLDFEFHLNGPDGAIVSSGAVSMPLKRDWQWSVGLHRKAGREWFEGCFGCFGIEAFPILDNTYAASDSDSIYVVWGGNYISNPVVY
jgi:hypothetical protein